jgi:hypothetical protein
MLLKGKNTEAPFLLSREWRFGVLGVIFCFKRVDFLALGTDPGDGQDNLIPENFQVIQMAPGDIFKSFL